MKSIPSLSVSPFLAEKDLFVISNYIQACCCCCCSFPSKSRANGWAILLLAFFIKKSVGRSREMERLRQFISDCRLVCVRNNLLSLCAAQLAPCRRYCGLTTMMSFLFLQQICDWQTKHQDTAANQKGPYTQICFSFSFCPDTDPD